MRVPVSVRPRRRYDGASRTEHALGLISSLFGNAAEIDAAKLAEQFAPVLFDGEQIERAFRMVRDLMVFTTARVILVDKQGITGSKTDYHSIFYRSITHFSVETAGHFDGDCELKMWLTGTAEPVRRELKRGVDVVSLQKALAQYCTRK